MQSMRILRKSPIEKTPRVIQVMGMFDADLEESVFDRTIEVEMPEQWNVGLIVGPSGCGKSTLAREMFGSISEGHDWKSPSIIDDFPKSKTVKEIVAALSSVGFSSPPSWMKPYGVLSNGEKFRADIARTILETDGIAVVDEFTSMVDRQVAKIASHAVSKYIRRVGRQFVAVSCHDDIAEWLEPDWIIYPEGGKTISGRSLRRPPIEIKIQRVHRSAWEYFHRHHYMTASISHTSRCFLATINGEPAAFVACIFQPRTSSNPRQLWRGHRTVCLPDYQGIGIGSRASDMVAMIAKAAGADYSSSTASPSLIAYRMKSPHWHVMKPAYHNLCKDKLTKPRLALTARCKWVGPAHPDAELARRMWNEKM